MQEFTSGNYVEITQTQGVFCQWELTALCSNPNQRSDSENTGSCLIMHEHRSSKMSKMPSDSVSRWQLL